MTARSQFFVGIGVAKAGTSWFARYFADHPQVWFSPVKELHVFDQILVPEHCSVFTSRFDRRIARLQGRKVDHTERTRGLLDGSLARRQMVEAASLDETVDHYRAFFDERRGDHRAFGEITPSYSLLPRDGYAALLQAFPNAHFLLLLRDPVDRFWSHLRFKGGRQEGFDPLAQFDAMLVESGAALRSQYDDLLARFCSVVPDHQRTIEFYEDIFLAPDPAGVERVCTALGIDFVEPDLGEVVKQSPSGLLPPELAQRAAAHFAPAYRSVAEMLGDLPVAWQRNLERIAG